MKKTATITQTGFENFMVDIETLDLEYSKVPRRESYGVEMTFDFVLEFGTLIRNLRAQGVSQFDVKFFTLDEIKQLDEIRQAEQDFWKHKGRKTQTQPRKVIVS